jgi:hypothetical protein
MAEEAPKIEWTAYEHEHIEHSSEWFWMMGILAVALAIAAVIFGNFLFAILIVISAFLLAMFAVRRPPLVTFELSQKGLRIDRTMYPYRSLNSFFVVHGDAERDIPSKLLLASQKPLMPLMVVPLDPAIDPELLTEYLSHFLTEEEHREPFAHHLLILLGL